MQPRQLLPSTACLGFSANLQHRKQCTTASQLFIPRLDVDGLLVLYIPTTTHTRVRTDSLGGNLEDSRTPTCSSDCTAHCKPNRSAAGSDGRCVAFCLCRSWSFKTQHAKEEEVGGRGGLNTQRALLCRPTPPRVPTPAHCPLSGFVFLSHFSFLSISSNVFILPVCLSPPPPPPSPQQRILAKDWRALCHLLVLWTLMMTMH